MLLYFLNLKYHLQEEDIRTAVTLSEVSILLVRDRNIKVTTLLGIFMLFLSVAVIARFHSQLLKESENKIQNTFSVDTLGYR